MINKEPRKDLKKEFGPTSWMINNKTSAYMLAIIISIFGIMNYNSIPKEQFPELVIPTIFVATVYPGTSPSDMENLVTRPIEKNLKSINGVKKVTSTSVQDFSTIVVEFNTGNVVAEAKQKVKDVVDKSRSELPNNLPADPKVMEVDFSEMPIMYINVSGNYPLAKLKKYAEALQDRIEAMKEITRVDIVGAQEREIQINVDMYKMHAASLTLTDIERAIGSENVTIAGGAIDMQGMKRSIRVVGEFKNLEVIKNITMKSGSGAIIKIGEVAEVADSYKDAESFARLGNKNVITLNVIKKSGENLIEGADKIKEAIADMKEHQFPKDLDVVLTNDMSHFTKSTLNELNNTIIIGFILVTIVLMFFMGFTNAFFVALSVPLSMGLAYIVLPGIGFTMNMLVMFSFIFSLGIVVDDAIVVIENTHRIFKEYRGRMDITQAAKYAAGEVFVPILSGTLTTIAPFLPLAFWPGIVGKFMFFLPVTIIITLLASLVIAYLINPVFAVSFMAHDDHEDLRFKAKPVLKNLAWMGALAIIFYAMKWFGLANFTVFAIISYLLHKLFGARVLAKFQHSFIPALMNIYERLLRFLLRKRNAYYLFFSVIALLILSFIVTAIMKPKVVFFPANEPMYIYTYIKLPVGTSLEYTDSITRIAENRVNDLFKDNPLVESIITNVAKGAADPNSRDNSIQSNRGRISIAFVESSKRNGVSTEQYLDKLRNALKGIAGAEITVEANKMGPPTGAPVNIEISGDNMEEIIGQTSKFKKYIDSLQIPGIEELKSDFQNNKPELVIDIDRERANHEGISTGQVGMEIRTAVLGKEISKYKEDEDQYPINLRYQPNQRKNIDELMNLKIIYRDMNSGMLRQIPLSSVAKISYINTYGGIKRKNLKRLITLSSNVLSGYNANDIVAQLNKAIPGFNKKEGIEIKLTGEQEDQKESMGFLSKAMLFSLFLIFFILVTQFNSVSKTLIILSEVLLSIIGVLLGFSIFHIPFSIVMTGIGIVALAGIVVRNGILLVEFTDVLKERGLKTRTAIIQAGKTRITPVLLTATATILGLVPLALGFNINFETLFTEFNPHIHFGGDNKAFFGALAMTIIYGLSFATFLTLLVVPAMYLMTYSMKVRIKRWRKK